MTETKTTSKNEKRISSDKVKEGEIIIKKYREKVEEITKIDPYTYEDSMHTLKRRCSFDLLDCALDCCSKGKCPPFTIDEHQMLVDISLASYIDDKIWYYGKSNFGSSHEARTNLVHERVLKIFNCVNFPSFEDEIFTFDYNLLKYNYHLFQRAIHRKAFWAHLSNPGGCHLSDFSIGTSIVKKNMQLHKNNGSLSKDTLHELITVLSDNYNVCSGLDLFRICFFRKKFH